MVLGLSFWKEKLKEMTSSCSFYAMVMLYFCQNYRKYIFGVVSLHFRSNYGILIHDLSIVFIRSLVELYQVK